MKKPSMRPAILVAGAALWWAGAFAVTSGHRPVHTPAAVRKDASHAPQCSKCHAAEVAGFARSKMAHSLRAGAQEPEGVVTAGSTTITMYSDKLGSWQSLENHGITTTYHVDYVIGSGAHADGYITDVADHLFQSPVAYYRSRSSYDLAPGFAGRPDPDFTRPIGEGCVFCHADSFHAIAGTVNQYGKPPFGHMAISCDRCHGPVEAHVAHPADSNIVNPANLAPVERDSVCEQCHLIGVARVLNPGRHFTDFHAGQPLETTFTVYRREIPPGTAGAFRVISHSEQLALSQCYRRSEGRLGCISCHDPHNEPAEPVAYYRARCLECHAKTAFPSDHPSRTSDCIGCHMPKREANDGGHTAFTDHRIQRRPVEQFTDEATAIAAWREPPGEFATRNLGIASVRVGLEHSDFKQVVSGYQMLAQVQQQFPQDSELYNTLGEALFVGRQYAEAAQAYAIAVRLDPLSSAKESSLGQAYAGLGDAARAVEHLEKAMQLDPLNLDAASVLLGIYQKTGDAAKASALTEKLASLTKAKAGSR